MNLTARDHIAQLCNLLRPRGDSGPLTLAKAVRADAYKQLLLMDAGGLDALVALRNPKDGLSRGSAPRRSSLAPEQLFPILTAYLAW